MTKSYYDHVGGHSIPYDHNPPSIAYGTQPAHKEGKAKIPDTSDKYVKKGKQCKSVTKQRAFTSPTTDRGTLNGHPAKDSHRDRIVNHILNSDIITSTDGLIPGKTEVLTRSSLDRPLRSEDTN